MWGPLFNVDGGGVEPALSLSETPEGTRIAFTHTVAGPFLEDLPTGADWRAPDAGPPVIATG